MADRTGTGKPYQLLALTGMVLIFFARFLFTGDIILLSDLSFFFYPGFIFLKKSLASGVLPHWSAFLGCGEPFLADIERAVLYPANVIYLLLPTGTATVVSAVFHVLLGGVGTYGLCRAWGVSRMGALVAAVVFAFNSFMVTRIEYCSARASFAWVPIVLLTFTAWLSSRGLRRLLLMAGALCLQFLAGYPESTFFTVCILVIYALFAGLAEWRVRRKWFCLFAPVLAVAAAGLLAVLLSMAQLLPTWEAVQVSGRSGPVDPQLDTQSLPPAALFSLLLPSIYGSPDLYWAPSCCHYNLGAFYVGVLPVVLFVMAAVFWGLGTRPSDRHADPPDSPRCVSVPFLLALLVLSFLYAAGKHTPLFPYLWKAIPLVQGFRNPSKNLIGVVLSLSCLAGIAMDWVIHGARFGHDRVSPRRLLLLRWGTPMVFFGVGVFVVLCLANDGRLGKAVLERYFNLGSVPPELAHRIPWDLILRDGLKLVAVSLLSVLLLEVYVFRPRMRSVAAWGIAVVAFADLLISNSFLLPAGSPEVLERPSAFLDQLRPEGKMIRFYERGNLLEKGAPYFDSLLPEGQTVTSYTPEAETLTSLRDNRARGFRLAQV